MRGECRNELLLRERHGKLTHAEELALGAHLEQCEDCRLLRDIGADFDSLGPTLDDGQRIERLAARVAARPRKRLGRIGRGVLLAACLSLLTGVAAAAIGWYQGRSTPAPQAAAPGASLLHAPRELPSVVPSSESVAELDQDALAAPASATPSASAARSSSSTVSLTAAQLFRKANDLRRSGNAKQAITSYRALERDFPASAEATLSAVSLGGLLLNRGMAGSALLEYERYLRAAPNGALAAEALYGRARSLQGLGRVSEERSAWQQLLSRFPNAAYAVNARRRLSELE
ncbi:MAG: outer membrane protein assembly factor BamD [Polyangiaceae bacterium]